MPWCSECQACGVESVCHGCEPFYSNGGLFSATVAVITMAAYVIGTVLVVQLLRRISPLGPYLRRDNITRPRIALLILTFAAAVTQVVLSTSPLFERAPELIFVGTTYVKPENRTSRHNGSTTHPDVMPDEYEPPRSPPCDPNSVPIGIWTSGKSGDSTVDYLAPCDIDDYYSAKRLAPAAQHAARREPARRSVRHRAWIWAIRLTTLAAGAGCFVTFNALFALDPVAVHFVCAVVASGLQLLSYGMMEPFFALSNVCGTHRSLTQLGFVRATGWNACFAGCIMLSLVVSITFIVFAVQPHDGFRSALYPITVDIGPPVHFPVGEAGLPSPPVDGEQAASPHPRFDARRAHVTRLRVMLRRHDRRRREAAATTASRPAPAGGPRPSGPALGFEL
jgi:hypothetical protein